MRNGFTLAALTAASLLAVVPASADVITLVRFTGAGTEVIVRESGVTPVTATNTSGPPVIQSGGDRWTGSIGAADADVRWDSYAAAVHATATATANAMNLKTRASMEGVVAPVYNPATCPIDTPFCAFNDAYNWETYEFSVLAEALVFDEFRITSASGTPSTGRLVYDIDGLNARWVDWLADVPPGGTRSRATTSRHSSRSAVRPTPRPRTTNSIVRRSPGSPKRGTRSSSMTKPRPTNP